MSRARHRPRPRPSSRNAALRRRRRRCRPALSISTKYSSTSPRMRPPRAIGPVRPLLPPRDRTRRTFSIDGLDDGADIHAIGLREPRMRHAPAAALVLPDLGEALVGLQRVAAGGDEIDAPRRNRRASGRDTARRSRPHRTAHRHRTARRRRAEHVLRQHIERAGAERRRVLRQFGHRARWRRGIPAPRSDWPARECRATARRAGGWRGRCVAADATSPSARRR